MKKRILILVVSMLTLVVLCFTMVACSISTSKKQTETNKPQETILAGGMQLGEIKNTGIKLMSANIEGSSYADYGISPLAENAFNLTAIVSPDTAANHNIDWYLSFENPNTEWSSGKSPSDYVTMSLSTDTKTNTISCLQPFGTSIILIAKSQDNPNISASCRLEYSQKVTSATFNIGNISINIGGYTEIKYEVSSVGNGPGGVIEANITTNETYTIAEDYVKSVTFNINPDSYQWFAMAGLYPSNMGFVTEVGTKNWLGLEYYFDYNYDIKNWVIFQRSGDISFKDLNTAEIMDYFANITRNELCTIKLTLTGAHNIYEYTSQLICTGYTNNTSVNQIDLSQSGYIF